MVTHDGLLAPSVGLRIPFTLASTSPSIEPRYLVAGPKPIVIGRSSKNESRGIAAQSDNAAFECPVVSREHAVIDTLFDEQYEKWDVTITDKASLHGTFVNGQKLTSHKPYTLEDGDMIELGANVARGNGAIVSARSRTIADDFSDTYKGVTVVFKAGDHDSNHDRFGGYSVPSDSEVEEESEYGDSSSDYAYEAIASTNTSPESKKEQVSHEKGQSDETARGSQDKPIDLEAFHTGSLRQVHDITAETAGEAAASSSQAPRGWTEVEEDNEDLHEEDIFAGPQAPRVNDDLILNRASHYNAISYVDEDEYSLYDNNDYYQRSPSVELGDHIQAWTTTKPFPATETSVPQQLPSLKSFKLPASNHWRSTMGVVPSAPEVTTTDKRDQPQSSTDNISLDPPVSMATDQATTDHVESVVLESNDQTMETSKPEGIEAALSTLGTSATLTDSEYAAIATLVGDTSPPGNAQTFVAGTGVTLSDLLGDPAGTRDSKHVSDSSNKRKREVTVDDFLYDLLGPSAARADAKQEHRRPQKKLKVKQSRKQSSLLRDLRHYALGAALGATGTFTLLASPLGGMLADWASSV